MRKILIDMQKCGLGYKQKEILVYMILFNRQEV